VAYERIAGLSCSGCGRWIVRNAKDRDRHPRNREERWLFCSVSCHKATAGGASRAGRMLRRWGRREAALRRVIRTLVPPRPRVQVGADYAVTCSCCGLEFIATVKRVLARRRQRCDRCVRKNHAPLGGGGRSIWAGRARAWMREGRGEDAAAAVLLRRLHLTINRQELYHDDAE
jgi:hypothetical protein